MKRNERKVQQNILCPNKTVSTKNSRKHLKKKSNRKPAEDLLISAHSGVRGSRQWVWTPL